jgi:hypothetical protein
MMKAFISGANLVAKLRRAGVIQMTTRAHIEPSRMSGVVNVTEVSMGWWDIPLEGHPMDTAERYFIAAAILEMLLLVATFSLL